MMVCLILEQYVAVLAHHEFQLSINPRNDKINYRQFVLTYKTFYVEDCQNLKRILRHIHFGYAIWKIVDIFKIHLSFQKQSTIAWEKSALYCMFQARHFKQSIKETENVSVQKDTSAKRCPELYRKESQVYYRNVPQKKCDTMPNWQKCIKHREIHWAIMKSHDHI